MINIELLKSILIVGISSSVITTSIVQKIKEQLKTKKYITLISFITSMIIGTLFSKNFSNINWIYSIWAGLFSFIGADTLYLTFEEKIFKRFSDYNEVIEIERPNETQVENV